MATSKAAAMAEQAARDKAQATLDEILKSLKQIKEKLGIQEPQQLGESPVDPTLQMRAEREAEVKTEAVKAEATRLSQQVSKPVDPKAEADRIRQQARQRPGNK